jgi:hypothetical protein
LSEADFDAKRAAGSLSMAVGQRICGRAEKANGDHYRLTLKTTQLGLGSVSLLVISPWEWKEKDEYVEGISLEDFPGMRSAFI